MGIIHSGKPMGHGYGWEAARDFFSLLFFSLHKSFSVSSCPLDRLDGVLSDVSRTRGSLLLNHPRNRHFIPTPVACPNGALHRGGSGYPLLTLGRVLIARLADGRSLVVLSLLLLHARRGPSGAGQVEERGPHEGLNKKTKNKKVDPLL